MNTALPVFDTARFADLAPRLDIDAMDGYLTVEAKAELFAPLMLLQIVRCDRYAINSPVSGEWRFLTLERGRVRCSCPAGFKGTRCWHIVAYENVIAGEMRQPLRAEKPVKAQMPVKAVKAAPVETVDQWVGANGQTLPTVADTHALFLAAARENLHLTYHVAKGLEPGVTKRDVLGQVYRTWGSGPAGAAHIVVRTHENNWTKLVKAGRIVMGRQTWQGTFYLPGECFDKTEFGLSFNCHTARAMGATFAA